MERMEASSSQNSPTFCAINAQRQIIRALDTLGGLGRNNDILPAQAILLLTPSAIKNWVGNVETPLVRLQYADDLRQVMLHILRQHGREDGCDENKIERRSVEGETIFGRLLFLSGL